MCCGLSKDCPEADVTVEDVWRVRGTGDGDDEGQGAV